MHAIAPAEADGPREQGRAISGRRRGRRRGVDVRPGSVKQARAEAGLSLGQVAQAEISRTAIYFVETGKAKPSMETLRLIATRTNKPLDFFLGAAPAEAEEMKVVELERLVAVGDNAAAVAAGEKFLGTRPSAEATARARYFMSHALIRLGRPMEGRRHVSAARVYFDQAGDTLMTAECLGWEAGAAQMLQDITALGLVEEALARCRSLKPVPSTTEARLLAILGHVHNSRHDYRRAIDAYEQSLAIDAHTPDLRRLSYVYGNLMLVYQELGQYSESARYAHRAMALYETLRDRVSVMRTENNLALLLHKQGDIAGAIRRASMALRMADELGIESGKAHVLMTMAELELARSGFAAASRHAEAALNLALGLEETANAGEAHTWLGRIAEARGDRATADAEFGAAFELFASNDAKEWLARGHYMYAEILEARGDLPGANRQLRRAMTALGMPSTVGRLARVAIA
ncbi:MAG TPA: tetratricopeptide repeat protein [Stellaceae bacterium]|nr:tetratricopeptide repeat protein [Stellaceae bacterium]